MATKPQMEEFFNWDNSFAIPTLSVLVQSQKKYCHQVKRTAAFVYFRTHLCQNRKYATVFRFCLCLVKAGGQV